MQQKHKQNLRLLNKKYSGKLTRTQIVENGHGDEQTVILQYFISVVAFLNSDKSDNVFSTRY